MIDAGIVGANDNVNETISDDMFDGIIDILDFPMEDIDAGGEAEELQGESSPLNDFSALPCPFSGNSCNETSNLRKSAGTQIEPMIVIDTCSGNISLHGDSSDDKESLKLQNSTTSEAGKSASEPFSQTTETSEGCSNSTKGKQKKKRRKKLSPLSGPMGVKKQWLRQPSTIGRCMHCNVTRTPQWRAGPYGPKTLCNACGVCYRRGSLFPEYRPASSPTFVASLHTNFRRKIVDMRKKAGQEEHAVVGATSLHSNSHGRVTKASHRGSQVGATFLTISDSKPGLKVTEVIMKASTGVGPISVASLPPPQRKVNEMRSDGVQEEKLATSLHSNCHSKVTKASYKGCQVGATFLTNSDSKPARKVTEVITKASVGVSPISVASLPPPQRKVNEMRSDGVKEEKLTTSLHSNSHSKVTKASYKRSQVGATFLTTSDSKSARKVIEVITKASMGVIPISVASLPPPQRKVNEMRSDGVQEEKLSTSVHSNSHCKVTKASYKGSQVGATFLTTSDSKPARKVTEVITKASTGVSPISVASLPLPQSKVNEMRSNGVQKEKLAAAMTTTFVASLHSNSHKKCSFQRPVTVRKCIHCEATRTPLWRRGPWGPKSLCNACGLRFRSGRLFPEYHPAASPTFVASFHSNSHKKVLEMRNKAITSQQLSSAAPDGNAPQPLTTQSIKKE